MYFYLIHIDAGMVFGVQLLEDHSSVSKSVNKLVSKSVSYRPTNCKHIQALPDCLSRCANFVFSIKSFSVAPEREFSRMNWMVSERRSSITAENVDKRLTLGCILPLKRKLEIILKQRKVQKRNLFSLSTNVQS